MEYVTGSCQPKDMEISDLMLLEDGAEAKTHGMVYSIKDMGDFGFVTLRKRNGLVQCVYEKGNSHFELSDIMTEASIQVTGNVKRDDRAPNGFEIHLVDLKVLSTPKEQTPVNLSKRKLGMSLETKVSMRPITLRNNRERAVFKPSFLNFLVNSCE